MSSTPSQSVQSIIKKSDAGSPRVDRSPVNPGDAFVQALDALIMKGVSQ
jgi:hypothetical protein